MSTLSRRSFVKRDGVLDLVAAGPLGALTARSAADAEPAAVTGYGPLVDKGDLYLPAGFEYQVISTQGRTMSDGRPTPGAFGGMGAFPGSAGTTVLIRDHENSGQAGEIEVMTGPADEYDESARGGSTKLVVSRGPTGTESRAGRPLYEYAVERDFAILGGTSDNRAGGVRGSRTWLTGERVVRRSPAGLKHGYIFEIDASADGPVPAIPIRHAGRMSHEGVLERAGIIYLTENRFLQADPVLGAIGASLYRYVPAPRGAGIPLARTSGPLEALKIRGEFHANMDVWRSVGVPYPVEWVPVPEPDHDDDTDERRDRVPGLTPTRIQAQDNGAAYFDRQDGIWAGPGPAKIHFACTSGGAAGSGQVWEYDPDRETLTLVFESSDAARLNGPDNIVVVPRTGDILLTAEAAGEQLVRGVTVAGGLYGFARSKADASAFCGACFDRDGRTLYLNQRGDRGSLPDGPAGSRAVTYAIHGPFESRDDSDGGSMPEAGGSGRDSL